MDGLKILMIDDHPIILEGYKKVLMDFIHNPDNVRIQTATTCDEASSKIENCSKSDPFDVVFLDIGLPPSSDRKLISGEDLGIKIREIFPDTKLIVLTMFIENIRLLHIIKTLNPEGFMIKSDVNPAEFSHAFARIIKGERYSSNTVEKMMRNHIFNENKLDNTDRQILYHLAKGVKTKELPAILPLSLASIEKRKKIIREILEVEDLRDISLINQAREKGFL